MHDENQEGSQENVRRRIARRTARPESVSREAGWVVGKALRETLPRERHAD